jgi:hypothetical protein
MADCIFTKAPVRKCWGFFLPGSIVNQRQTSVGGSANVSDELHWESPGIAATNTATRAHLTTD